MVCDDVLKQFQQWRISVQYVDKNDLMAEFEWRLDLKITGLQKERDEKGILSASKAKTVEKALKNRIKG